MNFTPERVAAERATWHDRGDVVVPTINALREDFARLFEVDLPTVSEAQYHEAVDEVYADGDRAVNVAALSAILGDLDVQNDYPGFVVDEILGRELAGWIAGEKPLDVLGEAAFHYTDTVHDGDPDGHENAGLDDRDAALAAGFQSRIPGWEWRESPSPFRVER